MTQPPRRTPPDPPGPNLDSALDFVNTTGLSDGQPREDLAMIHDALHWLVEHALLTPSDAVAEGRRLAAPILGDAAMARLRAVRGGLRELVDAIHDERAPAADAVRAVNRALALRETIELVPGPYAGPGAGSGSSGLRLERRREGTPLDRALAEVARRIAAEFDEGRPERFRVCGNDRCQWAFYDRSRPGSRRWCEMSSCGNRMKAARHRARARQQAGASGT